MEATPSTTAASAPALPIRQSCDRCHKQKLRCTRTDSRNTGACDRCVSKRTQCIYSSSLPKGRPSLNRPSKSGRKSGNVPSDPSPPIPATPVVTQPQPREFTGSGPWSTWGDEPSSWDDPQGDVRPQELAQPETNWHNFMEPTQFALIPNVLPSTTTSTDHAGTKNA